MMDALVLDVPCLLYTSDAADERSSVDLGGRRLIKKKTQQHIGRGTRRSSGTPLVHHIKVRAVRLDVGG